MRPSLRRDGLRRLGAERRRHRVGVAEHLHQANVGSKPVASNHATSYTTTFADLGGAVLLALSATGTATYRKGLEVGWADALAAGASLDDIVVLCVSGISSADIDAFGASSAADAVRKIAEENTEVDIVIATGISGLRRRGRTNWALNVLIVNADADTSVARFTFDMDAGSPIDRRAVVVEQREPVLQFEQL